MRGLTLYWHDPFDPRPPSRDIRDLERTAQKSRTISKVNRPGNSILSPTWERGWNHGKEANWV